MPTLLIAPGELAADAFDVTGDPYRHLFRAARLAVGDALRVVDGEGRAREGRVAAVDRRRGTVELGAEAPSLEPSLELELVVAALRPERASWLVEKATEVGARAVRFVATERTPRSFGPSRLARLERVARAAVEQCGRARLPEVSGVHPWEEVGGLLAGAPPAGRRVLDAAASEPLAPLPPEVARAALLVGPEGGWSAAELEALAGLGCAPASLGERVLRVETAAVVGAARLLVG